MDFSIQSTDMNKVCHSDRCELHVADVSLLLATGIRPLDCETGVFWGVHTYHHPVVCCFEGNQLLRKCIQVIDERRVCFAR